MEKRGLFSSKIGFVLAAAGSAVGLGNLWRFPYLAAKYGGGMFILVYVILAFTFGISLMIAEVSIGRKTGLSAIKAFEKLDKKYSFIGYLGAIIPAIICPYYCVIGGWVLKFLWLYISTDATTIATSGAFTALISNTWEPLFWFLLFLAINIIVIFIGVEKGIEKFSTILMPILFILIIILAIFSCSQPGAVDGLKFYFTPNIKDLSAKTILGAMTQLFYSLSLAMGIMITYGSYMKKDNPIESSCMQIVSCDSFVALMAGLIIIPAIFSFTHLHPGTETSELLKTGPSLMFVIMPQLFDAMPGGRLVAILFFFLVFFAAITSSISLYETVVSNISDTFKYDRKTSIITTLIICIIIGSLSSLGYGPLANVTIIGMQFLDLFDFVSNSVLMPITAFATCIFIGYVLKPKTLIEEIEYDNAKFNLKVMFIAIIKFIAPVIILIILIVSLLQAKGIITI